MYHTPLTLTQNTGNNALNFNRRLGEVGKPRLHVPSLIDGALDDVQVGDQVVFEDFDEYDQLQRCIGLKHLVRFTHPQTGKPVIVVDNHNHVFWFWYQAWHQKQIQRGATLVHIDQHKDTRIPGRPPTQGEITDLEKLYEYTNSVLNVGNYIPPAMEEGLVEELISVTSEGQMDDHPPKSVSESLIVNVDLDFWAPELDYIDQKKKDRFTQEWMMQADLITVATSPFFIEQERAIGVLRGLIET